MDGWCINEIVLIWLTVNNNIQKDQLELRIPESLGCNLGSLNLILGFLIWAVDKT